MKHTFAKVVWDDAVRKYYVYRPDCPEDKWQEITLGGALDLANNLYRYVQDFYNQNNGTHLV